MLFDDHPESATPYTPRRDPEDDQQSDVHIRNLQRNPVTDNGHVVPHGNYCDRSQREYYGNNRRCDVQRFVHMWRSHILFKNEFDTIRSRLQQAERADPRGAPAVLDVSDHFALKPYSVGDRCEQHEEGERDLDYRENYKRYHLHNLLSLSSH